MLLSQQWREEEELRKAVVPLFLPMLLPQLRGEKEELRKLVVPLFIPMLLSQLWREEEELRKSVPTLVNPMLIPQLRKEWKNQKFVFPLFSPILLPQRRRGKLIQEKFVFPFIPPMLLPRQKLVEQQRHRHPPQLSLQLLSCPTVVAMGTQKSVPFAWSLLQNRRLGHQTLVIIYSVSIVSKSGLRMPIHVRLIDRCLTAYLFDDTRTEGSSDTFL
jgi:hypothetical protein